MRDGPLRGAIKRALADAYVRDLERRRARLAAAGQLHWELGGACEGCGLCCDEPAIVVGRALWFLPLVSRAWLWWQRVVNGFVLVGRVREARAFLFRCTHFDPTTRRCDSYETRPGMCRDYPRLLLESVDPEFFDRCGHRPIARGGAAMIAALQAKGVAGEQLVQIKRKLRLE
jgi:uncharacterized protein